MSNNLVELLRKKAVCKLFQTSFKNSWSVWKNFIVDQYLDTLTPDSILNLGDNLKDIFKTTSISGRSQSTLSAGGTNWESLVCYYLNLCLIGRRTVVIKNNKQLVPSPIADAISVNYQTFKSNTESDLIALTFPEKEEYSKDISLLDDIPMKKNEPDLFNIFDYLCKRDFDDIEIHIIQCKTNWNDNAQIPMLWDMVYASKGFINEVTVGQNNYDIDDKVQNKKFSYSFVTVPTVNECKIKSNSTCVQRVKNLSGGNYWGLPSKSGVAFSVKEMLKRNLSKGSSLPIRTTLCKEITFLSTEYSYFRI